MNDAANPAQPATSRVACDVLTGYLGSGKTTLLNRFLRTQEARGTAVVVNEVGAIGIDQLILSQVSENVVLLESGCLCCSLSGSLRETLLDLKRQARMAGQPLARVVIETTGLAEPAPILNILLGDQTLSDSFVLGRVITTVDAQQALEQIRRQRETLRQVALADVLAITKTDLADEQTGLALSAALDGLNATARRVRTNGVGALAGIFGREIPVVPARGTASHTARATQAPRGAAPQNDHTAHSHDSVPEHTHAHGTVASVSLRLGLEPIHPAGLAAWMHLLVNEYGDRLLRCKGLLHMSNPARDVFVQGVGNYFHPLAVVASWPDDDPGARLVVIGEQIAPAWLQGSLGALRIDEPGLLPRTLEELNQVVPPRTQSPAYHITP